MARRTRRSISGASLIEVITASTISVMVLGVTVMTLLSGSAAWVRGQSRIEAESDAQSAVRIISQQLREAWIVTVDANGQGINYQYPQVDGTGTFINPPAPDLVVRRIALVGTDLVMTNNGVSQTIARGVITTDPQTTGGLGTYKIFTGGGGTITRQVTVQVVTKRLGHRNQTLTSRNRETIFLRNVPDLTR